MSCIAKHMVVGGQRPRSREPVGRDAQMSPMTLLLNRAGALLLCRYDQDVEQLDIRVVRVEGASSSIREDPRGTDGPDRSTTAWSVIDNAFAEETMIVGPTRRSVRKIPEEALRRP